MALFRQIARAFSDVGHVLAYRNNTVHLSGLEGAKVGSVIRIDGKYTGYVCALFKWHVSAIVENSAPNIAVG
jgi:energy-coupling factor transporter ATP-binding protein EcfA2